MPQSPLNNCIPALAVLFRSVRVTPGHRSHKGLVSLAGAILPADALDLLAASLSSPHETPLPRGSRNLRRNGPPLNSPKAAGHWSCTIQDQCTRLQWFRCRCHHSPCFQNHCHGRYSLVRSSRDRLFREPCTRVQCFQVPSFHSQQVQCSWTTPAAWGIQTERW